ncbi:MAG TPA: FlgD immunoglobulin-like domain containing protein, partial [Candidatus Krumholzibacteria bacterium]|nr:FlgD immunoglobulin-like domain containing protein [Candidatus Krumholzibacteria bacterium]
RLGTSQSSGQDYESQNDSLQVEDPLEIGTQYYWRVTAIDSDNSTTVGPWWTFTTPTSNLPPTAPANPDPADHATGQGSTVMLQWSASDPEGLPLTYTVCFGTSPTPPQIAAHWPRNSFTMYDLQPKDYYWVIVAHDVDGNSTTGPRWTFHPGDVSSGPSIAMFSDASGTSCTLADNGPGLKNIYVFVDGPATYTGVRFAAPKPSCFNATWMYDSSPYVTIGSSPTDVSIGFGMCMDPPLPVMTITYMSAGNTTGCCQFKAEAPPATGKLLVTDCSFAEITAASTPLGISSDNSCASCGATGLLNFAATQDSCGAGVPHRMTVALNLNAAITTDNASVDIVMSPSLHFISVERGDLTQNWTTFNQELNGNVLSLSASGGLIPAGVAGSFAKLTFETDCCQWTSPAELGLADALGDFASTRLANVYLECRYPPSGDVDNDGNLTLEDAQCAMESYLYWPISSPGGCGRLGADMRADVNCSETPTPGDACCIYRQLTDHSCSFCNGDVHTSTVAAPRLEVRSIVENQDVVVVLSSSAINSINSLGLELTYPKELKFLRVEAPGNDKFAALQSRVLEPGRVRIGGYANNGAALPGDGDLIAVRFRARAGRLHGSATALRFVDDLAGASNVSTSLETTIGTPVPGQVVLHQNSPNPFNPETTIRFELPSAMRVQLSIFDVHGRLVRKLIDEQRAAGASTAEWNGRDDSGAGVATGVYFYVLDAAGSRYQRKMILLK